MYSKTCLKRPLKKNRKIGFQYPLMQNAGQKCCIMLQGEHSAILSTFIKQPFSVKTFVLSISKWSLKTGFTTCTMNFSFHGHGIVSVNPGYVDWNYKILSKCQGVSASTSILFVQVMK